MFVYVKYITSKGTPMYKNNKTKTAKNAINLSTPVGVSNSTSGKRNKLDVLFEKVATIQTSAVIKLITNVTGNPIIRRLANNIPKPGPVLPRYSLSTPKTPSNVI